MYAANAGKYSTPYFMTHFNDRTPISTVNEKQGLYQSLDISFIDINRIIWIEYIGCVLPDRWSVLHHMMGRLAPGVG